MFCGNCGEKLNENAKFCPYCGRSASIVENEGQASQHKEESKETIKDNIIFDKKFLNKNFKYQSIFNILSLIFLGIIFIIIFTNIIYQKYNFIYALSIILYYIRYPLLLSAYPSMCYIKKNS
jgi:uncharacterized membrane protein YvbJ